MKMPLQQTDMRLRKFPLLFHITGKQDFSFSLQVDGNPFCLKWTKGI